jgi:hypothetical protein
MQQCRSRCWQLRAGLACCLLEHDEGVVEGCRPKRPASRTGAKTDADRCGPRRPGARPERLAAPGSAGIGRRCGCCWHPTGALPPGWTPPTSPEALIVGSCSAARRAARPPDGQAIRSCATLGNRPARSRAHRATVRARRATAGAHRAGPGRSRRAFTPRSPRSSTLLPRWLPELPGWDQQRRSGAGQLVACRPAALARRRLRPSARVSPIPASSGQHTRHRLQPVRGPAARTAPCTPSPKPACATTR